MIQTQVAIDLLTVHEMEHRQRSSQPHGPTGEQHILRTRIERLPLIATSALPAGDEEMDRDLVKVI